jgi:hypothetical protein
MAFELFNFYVGDDGAADLISIIDPTMPAADRDTPLVVEYTPSTTALPMSAEVDPMLEISTPSVGSNDFQDPPPSPTTAYCVECDAYHFVGIRDYSPHKIASCEDPRWLQSIRRSLSANGLSTPSRSNQHPMTLTTSRGYTRTTHV